MLLFADHSQWAQGGQSRVESTPLRLDRIPAFP